MFCGLGTWPARGEQRALLVGVTTYPALDKSRWLQGPANDVVLMRLLLHERFGIPDANIATLSEGSGPDHLPTRANIDRELSRLMESARPGDQIVVYLSGHGTLAPHPGSDACDGVFLPRDIARWNGKLQAVPNGITDRDLSPWARRIAETGASLWLVVDSCHSGGLTLRGEMTRAVAPQDLGIPSVTPAEPTRGSDVGKWEFVTDSPLVSATYACRSTEATVERDLPSGAASAKPYGLFTYTLDSIVQRSEGALTYAEVVRRINAEYSAMGRVKPIALAEGLGRDREVLGSAFRHSDIRLLHGESGLRINAGRIAGFSDGTILAVYPPPGRPDSNRLVGYVRISASDVLDAEVTPIAYDQVAAPASLPDDGMCRPVYIDYGIKPIRVVLDPQAPKPTANLSASIEWTYDPGSADLIVRPKSIEEVASGRKFECPPTADGVAKALGRIARARALLQVAAAPPPGAQPDVRLELLRHQSKQDLAGDRVGSPQGITLREGDLISFKVENRSDTSLDVTLLYIDSGYGITELFPRPGTDGQNRLAPAATRDSDMLRVTTRPTAGAEQVVLIAVKSEGAPADFGLLAQETTPLARGKAESPLARLLLSAEFGSDGPRGLPSASISTYAVRTLKWETR